MNRSVCISSISSLDVRFLLFAFFGLYIFLQCFQSASSWANLSVNVIVPLFWPIEGIAVYSILFIQISNKLQILVKEQNNLSNLCNFQIHEKLFKEKGSSHQKLRNCWEANKFII